MVAVVSERTNNDYFRSFLPVSYFMVICNIKYIKKFNYCCGYVSVMKGGVPSSILG